eukprot:12406173-Karenia_brevis.AAC.1
MVTELSPSVVVKIWKWFGMIFHGVNDDDKFRASIAPAIPKNCTPSTFGEFRAIVKDGLFDK